MGEGKGGMFWENSIETYILSRVKQITSPAWMHETSARGLCTGKTHWDGVGREAGGGIGMGNTCKSMADSCQKPLQYCKVISLQLIKINGKKKKEMLTQRRQVWKKLPTLASLKGWIFLFHIFAFLSWKILSKWHCELFDFKNQPWWLPASIYASKPTLWPTCWRIQNQNLL